MYTKAVILAAGKGSRLYPLTDIKPKPLVEVNNTPIIYNTLNSLEKIGVKKVVIVTGYLSDVLEASVGLKFKSIDVEYIYNNDYSTTNSMYSLYLGLKNEFSTENLLVIEGDVFFDPAILLNLKIPSISWFGDSSINDMDGCYLKTKYDKVSKIGIYKSDELNKIDGFNFLKSAGIVGVSKDCINLIKSLLDKGVTEGKTNLYYDLIFAENIDKLSITSVDISGKKWFEIDTVEDLKICEEIFRK